MRSGVTKISSGAYNILRKCFGGRKMRRHCRSLGGIVIFTGVVIILAIVLPTAAWWLVLGVVLIATGLKLLKSGI